MQGKGSFLYILMPEMSSVFSALKTKVDEHIGYDEETSEEHE